MKKVNYEIIMNNKDDYSYYNNSVKEEEMIKKIGKTDQTRIFFVYITAAIMIAVMLVISTLYREVITQNLAISLLYMIGGAAFWGLLYFLCGLLFYSNVKLSWYFKDLKSPKKDKYLQLANTAYGKWVEKYSVYLGKVDFNVPTRSKTKRKMVGFILVEPKKRKYIYNGKIDANVPYYCITFTNHRKMAFLPGFILYTSGNLTKIIKYKDLEVLINPAEEGLSNKKAEKKFQSYEYHYVVLRNIDGSDIQTFFITKGFNQNFFNFKW